MEQQENRGNGGYDRRYNQIPPQGRAGLNCGFFDLLFRLFFNLKKYLLGTHNIATYNGKCAENSVITVVVFSMDEPFIWSTRSA